MGACNSSGLINFFPLILGSLEEISWNSAVVVGM